jgi:hypothetical protein
VALKRRDALRLLTVAFGEIAVPVPLASAQVS